jgi:HAD superfamily hydrolase (TIGR01509 family)
LFDMDGVITDNLCFHVAAWQVCLRERYGLALADDDRRVHAGLVHEILERVIGRVPSPDEAHAFHDLKEARYRDLARGALVPLPGLHAYLGWLAARGIPAALVTGSDRVCTSFVLAELALSERFPITVTGEDVQRGKPAPDAYLLAAARLGIAPADCVVHEDSEAGIASGRAAGATVAALTTSAPASVLLAAGACWAGPDFEAWLATWVRDDDAVAAREAR